MTDTQRKAVVDGDGNVVNVILVDPGVEFDPGPGLMLVIDGGSNGQAAIGGRWDDGKFVDPPAVEPFTPEPEVEDVLTAMADILGVDPAELKAKVREIMADRENARDDATPATRPS
jgi:hypothetical protein